MRIAEYKQIDTRTGQRVISHDAEYDEEGNIIAEAFEETIDVEVPVMGMVYRDATAEEEAEIKRMTAEIPPDEPTQLDVIEAQVLYTALMTDTLLEEDLTDV